MYSFTEAYLEHSPTFKIELFLKILYRIQQLITFRKKFKFLCAILHSSLVQYLQIFDSFLIFCCNFTHVILHSTPCNNWQHIFFYGHQLINQNFCVSHSLKLEFSYVNTTSTRHCINLSFLKPGSVIYQFIFGNKMTLTSEPVSALKYR